MLLVIISPLISSPDTIIMIVGHSCNLVCGQRVIAYNISDRFFPPVLTRQALTMVTVTSCILTEWAEMIKTVHHYTSFDQNSRRQS